MPQIISPQQIVTCLYVHCGQVTTFIRHKGPGAYKFYENVCGQCRAVIDVAKQRAMAMVSKAINEGNLHRPDRCELCTKVPLPIPNKKTYIFAHHACGYDEPLRVWWLCHQCNQCLKGYEWHSNQRTMEQARKKVAECLSKRH